MPKIIRGLSRLENAIVEFIVDDEDWAMLYHYAWHVHGNNKGTSWYVCTGVSYKGVYGESKKVNVLMQHAIMGLPPIDHDWHHKNGDIKDNRKENYELLHHDVHGSISGRTKK